MNLNRIVKLKNSKRDRRYKGVFSYNGMICLYLTNQNLRDKNQMDVSFKIGNEKFNYRVCAMIISDGKILAMHDERSPYYYLPGGRVAIGETAENAVIREIREELGVTPKIVRPVWLNQAFFTEDVNNLHYHELCIYFLMDITDTDLLSRDKNFTTNEGDRIHTFE